MKCPPKETPAAEIEQNKNQRHSLARRSRRVGADDAEVRERDTLLGDAAVWSPRTVTGVAVPAEVTTCPVVNCLDTHRGRLVGG